MLWSQLGSHKYIDFKLKKILRPKGNFADISYLEERSKLHGVIAICTLYDGALACNSLFYMLL